jgi:CHAT domain-containing protein
MNPQPPFLYSLMKTVVLSLLIFCVACGKKNKNAVLIDAAHFDSAFLVLAKLPDKSSVVAFAFSYELPASQPPTRYQWSNSILRCADSLFFWKRTDSALLLLKKVIDYHPLLAADSTGAAIFCKAVATYNLKGNPQSFEPAFTALLEKASLLTVQFPHLKKEFDPFILRDIAIQYNQAGDLKKSSNYYQRFYAHGVENRDTNITCVAIANYAIALNEAGLTDSAINLCRWALTAQNLKPQRRTLILKNIADAFFAKSDFNQAQQYWQQAKQSLLLITEPGKRFERSQEVTHLQARLFAAVGRYQQSSQLLSGWLDSVSINGNYRSREVGKLLLMLGDNYLQLARPDSAQWFYHQALYTVTRVDSANSNSLPRQEDIYAENTLMDALDGMANALDAQYARQPDTGLVSRAFACRQLAFETERKLLETFTYDEAMQAQLAQSKQRSKKALLNCHTLWQLTQNTRWVELALQVSEKSKAVALLHSIKRNRAALGNDAADSLFNQLQQLRYQEIKIAGQLNGSADSRTKDSLLKLQQKLNEQYLVAESTLNQQHPELKRSGMDAQQLGFDHLRSHLLNENNCLLEYFETDSLTAVTWLGDNGQNGIYLLPKGSGAMLKNYIQQLQQPGFFENDSNAFYTLAQQCTETLLPPPVRKSIAEKKYRQLLVVPDGQVSLLPFEALLTKPGRFLVNDCVVNTGYSVSTLLTNYNATVRTGNRLSIYTPFSKSGVQQLPRLPFTNDEAAAVLKQFPAGSRHDAQEASIGLFWKELKELDIIHIASHAKAMDSLPPRIVLHDSIITMPELYAGNTHARLVVLSACQTGAGAIDPNEGPLSLSRAFYYAGAQNVINSLWQVNDNATAKVFGDFYAHFPAQSVTASLRQAKLNYLQQAIGPQRAPYYWAGLIHVGYEGYSVASGTKNRKWWWAIATLPLIGGLYWYSRRRKR